MTLLAGGSSSTIEEGEGDLVRSLLFCFFLFFLFLLLEEEEEELTFPLVSPSGAPLVGDSSRD